MNTKQPFKNKLFLTVFIILCFGLIAGAVFASPYIAGQYIKIVGINLSPDSAIEPLVDIIYLQTDERWKYEYLAQTESTLEESGCLTCVVATDLLYMGYDVNPIAVNNKFNESGAYTPNGELIWYKINSAYSGISYEYKKAFSGNTISSDLYQGYLPIVKVKYNKTGVFHWVLVVGADEKDFLVLDPLKESGEVIPLSTHGKVYAYRVLKKEN